MTDINKHIEVYLLYYLQSELNPEFAVLLQGEWGCGKTRFIKKFIEKYSENEGLKFLYITLYGVRKYSEIRIPDFINKTEKCILVFDDIERCDISIKNILGFINNFVEHQKLRVILLANEEQLHIKEENENDNWLFNSIKEKLIGKSFKIKSDFDSAFEDFLTQIQTAEISEFLKTEKQALFDIFNIAGFQNLRHLKQSLWDFERFYNSIPDRFKDNFKLLADFLLKFIALSFEIKGGNIEPAHLREMESFYAREIAAIRENPGLNAESHPIDNVLEKYTFLSPFETLFPAQFWFDLFENGYVPESELTLYFEDCKYYVDKDTAAWVKLLHFEELEDDIFEGLLKDLFNQMRDGKISEPGNVLNVCGLVLKFSEKGLISENLDEALEVCRKFIDKVKENGFFKNILPEDIYDPREKESYDGLRYAGKELGEFNTIEEYLKEKIIESNKDDLPKAGSELLELLGKNPDEACEIISLNENDHPVFTKHPIFQYIDLGEFYKIFLKLKNPEKRRVIDSLETRYKEHLNDDLRNELSFLISLNVLIREEAKENKGKLSGYILDTCENILGNVIDHIEYTEKVNREY